MRFAIARSGDAEARPNDECPMTNVYGPIDTAADSSFAAPEFVSTAGSHLQSVCTIRRDRHQHTWAASGSGQSLGHDYSWPHVRSPHCRRTGSRYHGSHRNQATRPTRRLWKSSGGDLHLWPSHVTHAHRHFRIDPRRRKSKGDSEAEDGATAAMTVSHSFLICSDSILHSTPQRRGRQM